jgi:hypothetical protein
MASKVIRDLKGYKGFRVLREKWEQRVFLD